MSFLSSGSVRFVTFCCASFAIHFASTGLPTAALTICCATSPTNAATFASAGSAGEAATGGDAVVALATALALAFGAALALATALAEADVLVVDSFGLSHARRRTVEATRKGTHGPRS